MDNTYWIENFINQLKSNLFDNERYFLSTSTVSLSIISRIDPKIISEMIADFFLNGNISSEIVFSTASLQLVGKEEVYDPIKTVCTDRGYINELLRQNCNVRSLHPFISFGGLRSPINEFLKYSSPHAYGKNSIADYLYKNNFIALCIGIDPRINTLVHHAEHLASVPYRYTKQFNQNIKINNKIINKNVFMNVLYRNLNFDRDGNKRLLSKMYKEHFLVKRKIIQNISVYTFKVRDYIDLATNSMIEDPLIWLPKSFIEKNPNPQFIL